MPRVNYGFKGVAILPADAARLGGAIGAATYNYEQAYGSLTPVIPPAPPTNVSVTPYSFDGTFSVSSTSGWQAGPTVVSGKTYTITASGTVSWGGGTSGPDGFLTPDVSSANFVAGIRPHEALIGKIDNGTPFLIGSSYSFNATSGGTLYFATNDSVRGDNSGSYAVVVNSGGGVNDSSASWTAPTNFGTGTFTYYEIRYSSDGGTTWTVAGTSTGTSFTLAGLTPATSYIVSIATGTTQGLGDATTVAYSNPARPPDSPTGVTAVDRDCAVTLFWSAPANTNGAAIRTYAVQYSSDSGTTWSAFGHTDSRLTSLTVTGLTNGTAYLFRVAAVNSAGTGSFSTASAPATPSLSSVLTETGDALVTAGNDYILW